MQITYTLTPELRIKALDILKSKYARMIPKQTFFFCAAALFVILILFIIQNHSDTRLMLTAMGKFVIAMTLIFFATRLSMHLSHRHFTKSIRKNNQYAQIKLGIAPELMTYEYSEPNKNSIRQQIKRDQIERLVIMPAAVFIQMFTPSKHIIIPRKELCSLAQLQAILKQHSPKIKVIELNEDLKSV